MALKDERIQAARMLMQCVLFLKIRVNHNRKHVGKAEKEVLGHQSHTVITQGLESKIFCDEDFIETVKKGIENSYHKKGNS